MFLTATQDICVDGWALTLFGSSNVIWQSISQMIGQPLGGFLGSPVLLTFESANMTNRLIRQPLGIADQPYGLFTLAQFVRFWGILFLITTCALTFLFREQEQNNKKKNNDDHLNLLQTYLYSVRLFKKKCFRQLLLILIGPHIGYAATAAMTYVILIR
jgi:PAT family acetyl-CoA transporter-like MFS transporter 1